EFKVDRLALKQSSRSGPKLSVADVNNDGADDFFIGGASGQCDEVFISGAEGNYIRSTLDCNENTIKLESLGSVFFDADGDGDKDIYIVSGGSEYPLGAEELMDRLYL